MITIHYDFTDGTEVSYKQGLDLKDNFTTCCLDFFCFDTEAEEMIIVRKDGSHIRRNSLLNPRNLHTQKQIRKSHNILKMFKAGSFEWNENNRPITLLEIANMNNILNSNKVLHINSFDYKICKEIAEKCLLTLVYFIKIDDHINDGAWYLK